MSRSNQNDTLQNPANRFFEWSGSDGSLSYYDKEKKEKVNVPLPFTFLLLDNLLTIKGYDTNAGSGIWANEIRQNDVKKSILTVKNKDGEIAKGLYENIKEKVKSLGGKYAQSCYIAYYEGKELVIGNITFSGSSFGGGKYKDASRKEIEVGAWMEFTKTNKNDLNSKAIVLSKNEQMCTNGATKFFCPKFSVREVSKDTDEIAIDLDTQLQEYLKEYFVKQNVPEKLREIPEQPSIESIKEAFANSGTPFDAISKPYANNGAVGSLPMVDDADLIPF